MLQLTPADANRQLEEIGVVTSVTVHSDKNLSFPPQLNRTWYPRSLWEKLGEETSVNRVREEREVGKWRGGEGRGGEGRGRIGEGRGGEGREGRILDT